MIHPNLYLAFDNKEYAEDAFSQTICLCRNEDLLFPEKFFEYNEEEFSQIDGFELIETDSETGFIVGFNIFSNKKMYGELKVYGNPIRER